MTNLKKLKKIKSKQTKKVKIAVSQKRYVLPMKFYVTPEERDFVLSESERFGSISNFVRHQIGLRIQTVGRKKRYVEAAFEVFDTEEREVSPVKINIISAQKNKASTISKSILNIKTIVRNNEMCEADISLNPENQISSSQTNLIQNSSIQRSLFDFYITL